MTRTGDRVMPPDQQTDRWLPRTSPRLQRWFARYLRVYFARSFDAVRAAKGGGFPLHLQTSFVIFSNHPSWWDPILFMLLNHVYQPDCEGYGPMDAAALEKYPLFERLGVFGVEQGSHRGAVRFLRTAEAILQRPRAVLWLTAEGRFTDPRRRPVEIQPGLAHLAKRTPHLTAVPLAIEYPFWNERRPEALVRFGSPVEFRESTQKETWFYQRRLEAALQETMDQLADEAATRDPELFDTLLLGKTGIGGFYDSWRSWRALRRGQAFVSSHEEERH